MRTSSSFLYGRHGSAYSYSKPPTNLNRGSFGVIDQQVWPEDIECVWPCSAPQKGHIYISNIEAAENPETLKKHNIKAVMTCAKGYDKRIPTRVLAHFEYYPCDDKDSCQIDMYFDQAADFLVKVLKETNVLVHCIAGVSRSVSMVLAYLMREHRMTYQEAFMEVKRRRKIIHPNDGFIEQLKRYGLRVERQRQRQDCGSKNTDSEEKTKKWEAEALQSRYPGSLQFIPQKEQEERLEKSATLIPHMVTPTKENKPYFEQAYSQNQMREASSFMERTNRSSTGFKAERKELTDQASGAKNRSYLGGSANFNPESNTAQQNSNYFSAMNTELNAKIEAIHSKYQKQREELMNKRPRTSDKGQAHRVDTQRRDQRKSVGKNWGYEAGSGSHLLGRDYGEGKAGTGSHLLGRSYGEGKGDQYLLGLKQADVDLTYGSSSKYTYGGRSYNGAYGRPFGGRTRLFF